ncbi:hypothetical protein AU468_09775 [Alkalispirochaeta sphaeroplastigenens]|uniref:DUF2357 domain-containing protein n=1 Tax=Alkalispirochaeta sphaeroplastigenens TaxID=1187066 RepID=A0A2S4JL60_9SPIO|nr:hypothetical protein AU468_09775 [Alkalispirochaeta sphaeroplastigenens]
MIRSPDWEMTVWTRDQQAREQVFAQTMRECGRQGTFITEIKLNPALEICGAEFYGNPITSDNVISEFSLDYPLLFENTLYEFEFVFSNEVSGIPSVKHRTSRINNAFRFSNKHGIRSLRGSINPGNNVGWLRLPVDYRVADIERCFSISIEVFPTKLDMVSDVQAIYRKIDAQYPLWRFALAEQTDQEFDRSSSQHQSFPLLWLAQFESLQNQLQEGVRHVIRSPHSRLVSVSRRVSAEKLKGRVADCLAERVRNDLASRKASQRYEVARKKLSVDTPENQFIKMVLEQSRDNLARIIDLARRADNAPDRNRLSPTFFHTLNTWRQKIEKQLSNPLFREIGPYFGMNSESLVLHQKAGYSVVYRCWQKLKMYLAVLGRQAAISMKNVAELYEVWCFLEIRDLLLDLGFTEVTPNRVFVNQRGLEQIVRDGCFGAFAFTRSDGVKVRLAHEPVFRSNTKPIFALVTAQMPDILLEVEFPGDDRFIWLFDAKYRIQEGDSINDYAPDDAINQMHRYRDALIYKHSQHGMLGHSRPVFGAYVLYPGRYTQSEANSNLNPYHEALQKIGIGAFPLVPGQMINDRHAGNAWLRTFLKEKLGEPFNGLAAHSDYLYIQDSARIPTTGMSQTRYAELTMVVTGAPQSERAFEYLQGFRDGSACWYHMKLYASERVSIPQNLMREVRFCVISVNDSVAGVKRADWFWHVDMVSLVCRSDLTFQQTGKDSLGGELYWLFKLSSAKRLSTPLMGFPSRGHHLKLCPLQQADEIGDFSQIKSLYSSVRLI